MGEYALSRASDNHLPCSLNWATSPSLPHTLGLWTPDPEAACSFQCTKSWRSQLGVDLKCVLDSRALVLNHCPILHCPPPWSQEFGTGKPGLTQSVQKLKTWKVAMMKVGWAAEVLSSYAEAKRRTAQMHSEKQRPYEKCGQCVEKLCLFWPLWRETLNWELVSL